MTRAALETACTSLVPERSWMVGSDGVAEGHAVPGGLGFRKRAFMRIRLTPNDTGQVSEEAGTFRAG